MFTLEAAKRSFFDRKAVTDPLERGLAAAFSNVGARVMTTARRSIRPRKKKTSPPGQPPFSHVGTLRRGILFAYEPGRLTGRPNVVIGAVILGSATGAPRTLEYGGVGTVKRKNRTPRPVAIAARPFMVPALAAEIPKTPQRFKNIIH